MMNIKDKLEKVNDNFNVYMYDNGFMLEISGRDEDDNWATTKILCNTLEELTSLIEEAASLPRD
jgi:hypothetical protein